MKRKIEIIVLVIYTILNLKIIWPVISEGGYVFLTNGSFNGAVTILIGLFLNAGLIIYCLRTDQNKK